MAASKMNIFPPAAPLRLEPVTPPSLREPRRRWVEHQVLLIRTLAKVPRTITSWLPRREP